MLAVIDDKTPDISKRKLVSLGYTVISLPPFPALDFRVASHPDMLFFRYDGKLFFHKQYYSRNAQNLIDRILHDSGLIPIMIEEKVSENYPEDVKLNAFVLGNMIFGKKDALASLLGKMNIVNVNQGYAKCSTVVLKSGVITADRSIDKALRNTGYDSLLISPGYVLLPGYDTGFLGGASGVNEHNKTVYFCGAIEKHPDFTDIDRFCRNAGYKIVSLSKEPLYDVGSILFF